jgi:hypothetical protein
MAVRATARRNKEFTTDEVWKMLDAGGAPPVPEPRAMGAVMKAMVKEGAVEASDRYRPSTRADCHHRPVRIWKSLIYDERMAQGKLGLEAFL